VRDDAANTFVAENIDHICKQPDRLKKVVRHHRHHDVELEVSVCPSPGNGRVVADHLCADHHYSFAHYRIHLAGHDRTAGLRRRKVDFANPASGTAPQPTDIVCNLKQTDRNRFQVTTYFDHRILSALCLKVVFCFVKSDASALLQMPQHFFWKVHVTVQTGAHCGSAKCQLTQSFDRLLRAFFGIGNLLRITGEFLPEPDRRRVHQMGSTDFYDVPEFFRFGGKCGV